MIGKNPVCRGRLDVGGLVLFGHGQRAVFPYFRQNLIEQRRTRSLHLNSRVAAIAAAMSYPNLEDLELRAEIDDEVEDFRKNEGVNNMAGDLNDSSRHSELSVE